MNIDWKKIYNINPFLIKQVCNIPFYHNKLYRILDGDWDKNSDLHESSLMYNNVKSFFEGNRSINLYPLVQEEQRRIFTEKLIKYYEDIKLNGYKSQKDLPLEAIAEEELRIKLDDEIIVAINRHGQLLLINGFHRLAIVKILGIQEIPVLVGIRHKEWVDFSDDFFFLLPKNMERTERLSTGSSYRISRFEADMERL